MHNHCLRTYTCRFVAACLLLATMVAPVSGQQVNLGIRAPIMPFMWQGGKSIDTASVDSTERKRWIFLQENLKQMAAWGGQWNIVYVYQWLDKDRSFARLRRVVEEHEKHGVEVVLRVFEDPRTYGRLLDRESAEFGYDEAYFRWAQSLAHAFRGKVKHYLIGNEVEIDLAKTYSAAPNMPRHLLLDYDQYAKLLETAAKAIKSADPEAQVANAGFSDKSLALAVADDLLESRGITEAQAFWESWKERGGIRAEGKLALYRDLHSDDARRKIEFVRRAVREPAGSDRFQLHYYGNWRATQPVIDWIRKEMRASNSLRPIIAAEVGYGVSSKKQQGADGRRREIVDYSDYSPDEHASNTVKTLATLLGNGIGDALYWSMRDDKDFGSIARLFASTDDPHEFKPAPVNRAFRMMGQTLGGLSPGPGRLSGRPGLWEFAFTGRTDVSLVWSEDQDLSALVAGAREIRDMEGQVLVMSGPGKSVTGPIYVFW